MKTVSPDQRDWLIYRAYKQLHHDLSVEAQFKIEFAQEIGRCQTFLNTRGSVKQLLEDLDLQPQHTQVSLKCVDK